MYIDPHNFPQVLCANDRNNSQHHSSLWQKLLLLLLKLWIWILKDQPLYLQQERVLKDILGDPQFVTYDIHSAGLL